MKTTNILQGKWDNKITEVGLEPEGHYRAIYDHFGTFRTWKFLADKNTFYNIIAGSYTIYDESKIIECGDYQFDPTINILSLYDNANQRLANIVKTYKVEIIEDGAKEQSLHLVLLNNEYITLPTQRETIKWTSKK